MPNEETIKAFEEVEKMKKNPSLYKGYTDVNEMIGNLLEEEDVCYETRAK